MAVTIVSRLLEAAELLLKEKPKSATFKRRAVSTAYYAVFHQLARLCTDCLLKDAESSDENYERIYRALDHSQLRRAFGQPPLAGHKTLRKIGDAVLRLQSERHRADYLPQDVTLFPTEIANELINQARQTIQDLNELENADRRVLASCLLFKSRSL